jgi:hypothetical protein
VDASPDETIVSTEPPDRPASLKLMTRSPPLSVAPVWLPMKCGLPVCFAAGSMVPSTEISSSVE